MSERKPKIKKKIRGKDDDGDPKPSKTDYKIAKYMKSKLPVKKTRFLNHQVSYFNSNKAIDLLLDSQWATGDNAIFTDRQSVVNYGNKLLQLKFFHRAEKIVVTEKDLTNKEIKKKREKEKEKVVVPAIKKTKDFSKESKKEEIDKAEGTGKEEKDKEKSKKKKSKIKLDMHLQQVFVDGSEAYVWMYDPIPFWYYIAGALMLFSAVGICLFPLWPPSVRQGVYYLSMAAASFLGVIFGLAIVRFIIFCFIWILSIGRHHLWILPNLTEDVGFFASFWPLYQYEHKGSIFESRKSKSKSKKMKEVTNTEVEPATKDKSDVEDLGDSVSAGETDKHETDVERVTEVQENNTDSEHSNSQTFEMVNKEDLGKEDDTSEAQED